MKWLLMRLWGPVSVAMSPRSEALIVVWTRDFWDALVFAVRTLVGGKTFFIRHNPPSVRRRRGLGGFGEGILARTAVVIVHSQWLAEQTESSARKVRVADHPPYSVSRDLVQSGKRDEPPGSCAVVGFVGSLRPDKGVADLKLISEASSSEWILMYMGPADESGLSKLRAELSPREVRALNAGSTPTDGELAQGLKSCSLVVAPYRGVTVSGSINLAFAVGCPVVGYDSRGVRDILAHSSRLSGPKELGEAIDSFLREPWDAFTRTYEEGSLAAEESWARVLGELA
ncbi:glycosyltransferase [Sinomonas atrocyanea]|uniref:glycosyltransferase n=1 Tax=Sinomonas atrocyanea TaxID=37927 RepID=UPI00359364F0